MLDYRRKEHPPEAPRPVPYGEIPAGWVGCDFMGVRSEIAARFALSASGRVGRVARMPESRSATRGA